MESARPARREQPTHECRRPVCCVPHVVIHPQYLEILHGRTDSLEGRRSLTRLFYWNRPVDLAVDDPRRHAPQLTSQRLEGWAAIRGDDRGERAGRGKERRNETADRDEGRKAGWIAIREVPHPISAHGQACEIHAVGVDLELSAHLLERGDGDLRRPPGPGRLRRHLWEDNDRRETSGILANGGAQAHLGRKESVVAALAGAVQEEDDGPALRCRVGEGDEHLVVVRLAGYGHAAV